jgi:DNA processing protein
VSAARACEPCLRRAWLIGRLAGHLEAVRGRIATVLALDDDDLLAALAGHRAGELETARERFDADRARQEADDAGLELICRCQDDYPPRLHELEAPPAVLHVAGGLERFLRLAGGEPVAVVGARRASEYGLAVARALGRGLGSAGVTVLSGMALGVDSAAHAGALTAAGPTVAVLPGGADRPYPASKRRLHAQLRADGAVISELPPGSAIHRWAFPARNRIVAALAAMTVVVEAGESSGALLTAGFARSLGRAVGAVPGRVGAPLAAGPNGLLAGGAQIVRDAQDVLDHLFGAGRRRALSDERPPLSGELADVLGAIAGGRDTAGALAADGIAPERTLAALAALELAGYVRREVGGRFSVTP